MPRVPVTGSLSLVSIKHTWGVKWCRQGTTFARWLCDLMGMVTVKAQVNLKNSKLYFEEFTQPQSAQARAVQLASERNGDLPVWVRARTRGKEFYSGCSRPKLYEWAAKSYIRSVSIREPGRLKGVRLFHLASILAFIERCEAGAFTQGTRQQTRQSAAPESARD